MRIAVANEDLRQVFSWSGSSRIDELQPQKEEQKNSWWYTSQRWAWTLTTTPTKRHIMPLSLVPGVRTHGLGWWHQEVHRWANAFNSTANFVTFNSWEREIGKNSRGVMALILLTYFLTKREAEIWNTTIMTNYILGRLRWQDGLSVFQNLRVVLGASLACWSPLDH